MSFVDKNQPDGTPTWIDLGIPDIERAMDFYRAVFGWEFLVGTEEIGYYTMCLLHDRPVAALAPSEEGATEFWWNVYFATADVDATAKRIVKAGGSLLFEPMDIMDQGRMTLAKDTVGGQFGLWQGRTHVGARVVNEPNSLVRNDLVTPDPAPAREFYTAIFDFTLDGNDDLPDMDFTFLRRPDGHEIGGIFGDPSATRSAWDTCFEVSGTDAAVRNAVEAGGSMRSVQDMPYGRFATLTDPFGTEFSVITRPES
jgi:predicted enzyme related to lactoylglutathione lyase